MTNKTNKDDQAPGQLRLSGGEIKLAKQDGDEDLKKFEMHAYTGAVVNTWWGRYIISIDGIRLGRQRKPILLGHDDTQIVGHSTKITKTDEGVFINGVISGGGEAAYTVVNSSKNEFPWQASVGMRIDYESITELGEGDTETVNGQEQKGPISIVTKSNLLESSFVALGADSDTSAIVLSRNGVILDKPILEQDMPKDEPTVDTDKIREEASAATRASEATRLAQLKAAFPGRSDFVLAQYEKGASVLEAKAALSEILEGELEEAKAERDELSEKIQAKAQTVGTAGAVDEKLGKPTDDTRNNPEAALALADWEWENEPGSREGFSRKEHYLQFRKRVLAGQLRIMGTTRVA